MTPSAPKGKLYLVPVPLDHGCDQQTSPEDVLRALLEHEPSAQLWGALLTWLLDRLKGGKRNLALQWLHVAQHLAAGVERVIVQAVSFFEQKQAIGERVRGSDGVSCQQRVIAAADDAQGVVEQLLDEQPAGLVGQRDQREIELAIFQARQ